MRNCSLESVILKYAQDMMATDSEIKMNLSTFSHRLQHMETSGLADQRKLTIME